MCRSNMLTFVFNLLLATLNYMKSLHVVKNKICLKNIYDLVIYAKHILSDIYMMLFVFIHIK